MDLVDVFQTQGVAGIAGAWIEVMRDGTRVGVIVFARMSSTRLPGKALMPVGHRPLLGHVLDRARLIRGANGLTLATSTEPADEPLVAFALREDLTVFRGSLADVARRALDCAIANGWTAFARVCGDQVFLDPAAVGLAIERMLDDPAGPPDLVSNRFPGSVARGLAVEVMQAKALARVLERSTDPLDREHITRYMYTHPEEFRLVSAGAPASGTKGLRFVVDTPRDLICARYVAEQLPQPATATMREVAELVRAWEQEHPEE